MNQNRETDSASAPRRRFPLVATALALLLLLLIGWRVRERLQPVARQPVAPLAVRTQVLEPIFFAVTRSYVGTIEAVERVVLSAELTGRVLSVPRREGQSVRQGDLLVRIDDQEEAREIGRLEAALQRLQADLAFWQPQLERDRRLLAGRSIAQEKLDETVRRLDGLRASIRENEQVLALARARRAYGEVRAPFAGVIQSVLTHPGELAMAGKPLIEVVGGAALKAVANVPQVDLRTLTRGQRVALSAPSAAGAVAGIVDRVYPALDVLSRTATVEVFLPSGTALRPGMVVSLEVFSSEADDALVVPRQALRITPAGEGVFLAREGEAPDGVNREMVATWRPVATGAAQGRLVRVVSGLAAGDAVIVTPNPQLREGRVIRV